MDQPAASQDRRVDVVLAEYNALRAEIISVLSSQQTFTNLNVTAATAITGLVLAQKVNPQLLLVAAVVSSVLGLIYVANTVHVRSLGGYINDVLRPIVTDYTGESKLLGWDQYFEAHHHRARLLLRGASAGLLFSAVPVVALISVRPYLDTSWSRIGWILALSLFIAQAGAWASAGIGRLLRRTN